MRRDYVRVLCQQERQKARVDMRRQRASEKSFAERGSNAQARARGGARCGVIGAASVA